ADVPAGSVVSAGQSVATITAGPLVLRLELPEAQGRNLRVGQSVIVSSDDLPGVTSGTIAQVYPAATDCPALTTEPAGTSAASTRPEVGARIRPWAPVSALAERTARAARTWASAAREAAMDWSSRAWA
ncbi:MAG: HlyD family secretion protein, partial [Brevundimonas sp.]